MRIEIQELNKHYGKQRVLHDVSLKISTGACFALLGPNGSGKSTLIKSLLGLVLPDNPEAISVDGHPYPLSRQTLVRRCGYMPQIPEFPDNLRVRELVSLLEEIDADLGIDAFSDKKCGELSQGMRQKVNILQALMYDRDLYILDEPTASLDPMNAYFLKEKVRELHRAEKTILFTSHIMKEVEELADDLCLFVDGKSILAGKPSELSRGGNLEDSIVEIWRSHEQKRRLDHP
jgi:Cu-processing system ATP-binding protein